MGILKKLGQKLRGEYKADEIGCYRAKLRFCTGVLDKIDPNRIDDIHFLKGICRGLEQSIKSFSGSFWLGRDLSRWVHDRDALYRPMREFLESRDGMLWYEGVPFPEPRTAIDRYAFSNDFMEFLFPLIAERMGYPVESDDFYDEGFYELDTRVNLRSGDIVFDCGANAGFFCCQALVRGAIVYAFEPMAHLIEQYLEPMAHSRSDMRIVQTGLADRPGKAVFAAERNNSSMAGVVETRHGRKIKRKNPVTVPLTTVDDYVVKNGVPRVDFIKADIEGAERFMLAGARQTVARFAPRLSICTYHLEDDPQVLRDLILAARPDYTVIQKAKKLYAYVESGYTPSCGKRHDKTH